MMFRADGRDCYYGLYFSGRYFLHVQMSLYLNWLNCVGEIRGHGINQYSQFVPPTWSGLQLEATSQIERLSVL